MGLDMFPLSAELLPSVPCLVPVGRLLALLMLLVVLSSCFTGPGSAACNAHPIARLCLVARGLTVKMLMLSAGLTSCKIGSECQWAGP